MISSGSHDKIHEELTVHVIVRFGQEVSYGFSFLYFVAFKRDASSPHPPLTLLEK